MINVEGAAKAFSSVAVSNTETFVELRRTHPNPDASHPHHGHNVRVALLLYIAPTKNVVRTKFS